MLVLQQSNKEIISYLGGYQIKKQNRNYRFNNYILIYQYNEEILLIGNLFTGSCIEIKTYEFDNLFTDYKYDYVDYCIKNYFIVPEDFDEDLHITEARNKLQKTLDITFYDHLNYFTIMTTSQCNARCPYCYEKNIKNKKHMSAEIAEKVARFIIENSDHIKDPINLCWYGGEPLYNIEPINIITNRIKASDIKFKASMISNGYLLNEHLINKVVYEWNIKDIQITLDGMNEKYNNTKNYIYKDDPNPFNTIINNIKLLISNHIVVSLRLNCNNENYQDIKELVFYLCEEFKNHPNKNALSIYIARLHEYNLSDEYIKELVEHLLELTEIVTMNGFNVINMFHGINFLNCCADSHYGIIINENGYICNCQHYIDKNFIGHIDKANEYDFEQVKSFMEYEEYTELCDDCFYKPACKRLKMCPINKLKCDENWKKYLKFNTIYTMIGLYHNVINNLINQTDKDNKCINKQEKFC